MVLRLEAVTFAVTDAAAVADFWTALLGRDAVAEPRGAYLPGDDTQVGLRFATSVAHHVGRPRLHLHLTSTNVEDQQRTVRTALRLGGRRLDVGQRPQDAHVVLADPGGNEVCVIEPGNNYLAGTGLLGEVTCDGSRDVGMFWRDALGWPLVWDSGPQTAIQSPHGGTKISWDAWATQPDPVNESDRQRFDLVADDLARQTQRLVSLGATRRSDLPDGVALADPDGHEFHLRAGY